MKPVRIVAIHWGDAEALRTGLEAAGHTVEPLTPAGYQALRPLAARPPDVVVLDLSRRISDARAIGILLRRQKRSRNIPLVFCGGAPEKVDEVRRALPDAVYSTVENIAQAVETASARGAGRVYIPGAMEPYAETPLHKKLTIRAGALVALIDAPAGFERKLGALPEGAELRTILSGSFDLALLFASSALELELSLPKVLKALSETGSVWILWPKKTSGVGSGVTQRLVRELAKRWALSEYKIASVDEIWSGLLFRATFPRE